MSDTRYIVYTTHCPKCNVLETKLKRSSIAYDVTDDIQPVIDAGFMTAPILYDKVEDKYYQFADAIKYINSIVSTNTDVDNDSAQSFSGCATCHF